MSIVRKIVVFGALASLMFVAVPASAQTAPPPVEFSAGWNYLHLNGEEGEDGESLPAGWYGEVAGNVTPILGIVGQVTGNYKSIDEDGESFDVRLHTFAGGLRLTHRHAQANPFVHVLFGGVSFGVADCNDCGDTQSMMQLGGGVNLMTQSPVGLRLGADWIHAFGDDGGNAFRFAIGLNFGR